MASTAHSDEEFMQERFDNEHELAEKVVRLAELVRSARHTIAFTGAGISTSAGIPDFRGPDGVWTRAAQGRAGPQGINTLTAHPTATHMALVALQKQGRLKYLVSQNCDGLHRRSGFPTAALSELHGNSNVEECEDCGQDYYRDFKCRRVAKGRDHSTGRRCIREDCGGRLLEWTIDFGQDLPVRPLERAMIQGASADLCIALGSSLTVTPAADIPASVAARSDASLVIVNLQKTPLTEIAAFQIYAKTDVVMQMLMAHLHLPVPHFRLRRRIDLCAQDDAAGGTCVGARGVDLEDPSLPVSILRRVVACAGTDHKATSDVEAEHDGAGTHHMMLPAGQAFRQVRLDFFGHYREPSCTLPLGPLLAAGRLCLDLEFDPVALAWAITRREAGRASGDDDCVDRPRDNSYGRAHAKYCKKYCRGAHSGAPGDK